MTGVANDQVRKDALADLTKANNHNRYVAMILRRTLKNRVEGRVELLDATDWSKIHEHVDAAMSLLAGIREAAERGMGTS